MSKFGIYDPGKRVRCIRKDYDELLKGKVISSIYNEVLPKWGELYLIEKAFDRGKNTSFRLKLYGIELDIDNTCSEILFDSRDFVCPTINHQHLFKVGRKRIIKTLQWYGKHRQSRGV